MRRVVVMLGIGPEVPAQAVRVAEWFGTKHNLPIDISHRPSGPEVDAMPKEEQRLSNLRCLRKELAMFANLRPIVTLPSMLDACTLKREVIEGVDMVVIRELNGGMENRAASRRGPTGAAGASIPRFTPPAAGARGSNRFIAAPSIS
jgi:isocitrate/isopropylmalate dehydrogenase